MRARDEFSPKLGWRPMRASCAAMATRAQFHFLDSGSVKREAILHTNQYHIDDIQTFPASSLENVPLLGVLRLDAPVTLHDSFVWDISTNKEGTEA